LLTQALRGDCDRAEPGLQLLPGRPSRPTNRRPQRQAFERASQPNDQRTPRNVAQGVRADHHAVSHPNSSCDERFQARAAVAVASIRVGDSQLGGFGASDEFPKWFGSLCI
jgi:hypothetical protein